jgi:hypothetical protein
MIYFLLAASVIVNCILFWYTKKLVEKLTYGVKNVDELQNLLDEYANSLSGMLDMETYYGDETMASAVRNTKMVVETCKVYKNSILETKNNETTTADDNG